MERDCAFDCFLQPEALPAVAFCSAVPWQKCLSRSRARATRPDTTILSSIYPVRSGGSHSMGKQCRPILTAYGRPAQGPTPDLGRRVSVAPQARNAFDLLTIDLPVHEANRNIRVEILVQRLANRLFRHRHSPKISPLLLHYCLVTLVRSVGNAAGWSPLAPRFLEGQMAQILRKRGSSTPPSFWLHGISLIPCRTCVIACSVRSRHPAAYWPLQPPPILTICRRN